MKRASILLHKICLPANWPSDRHLSRPEPRRSRKAASHLTRHAERSIMPTQMQEQTLSIITCILVLQSACMFVEFASESSKRLLLSICGLQPESFAVTWSGMHFLFAFFFVFCQCYVLHKTEGTTRRHRLMHGRKAG